MQPYRAKVVGLVPVPHVLLRSLALGLLALALLFSLGCGGSSSTTTTPVGPAPTFTSIAPTIAREGVLYTYDMTTTTTDNSTVTYSLTGGPTGAAISGNTLTWTPTHAQARTSNLFTVKATTSKNGTTTQSFSIVPTGYVNGTAVDHAVTGNGVVDYAEDLSASTIEALVPNGKGAYNTYKGTGTAAGTFSIANVPSGSFLLHITHPVAGTLSNDYVLTSTSDIDVGTLVTGRPDAVPIRTGVTVSTDATLSVPPAGSDTVVWASPDADAFGFPSAQVTQPYIASFPQTGHLIDSSKGDRAFLVHYKGSSPATGVVVSAIAEDIEYTSIQETDGTTLHLPAGQMTAVTGSTTDPVIKLSQFDGIFAGLTNNATVQRNFSLVDTGYAGTYGYADGVPLVYSDLGQITSDIDLGSQSYGLVTSAGVPFFRYLDAGSRKFPYGGGSITLLVGSQVISNVVPSSATPLVPVLGIPRTATVDGTDFYYNQTNTSLAPQVSWGTPSVGTASYSELTIFDITGATASQWNFFTSGNGVAVPSGILQSGHTYVFELTSVNDTGSVFATAPFRHGTSPIFTYAASGVITGGVPPVSTKMNAASPGKRNLRVVPDADGRLRLQQVK